MYAILLACLFISPSDEEIRNRFKNNTNPPPQTRETRRKNESVNQSIYKALVERKHIVLWINCANMKIEENYPNLIHCDTTAYGKIKDKRVIIGRYENGFLRRIDLDPQNLTITEFRAYLNGTKSPPYNLNLGYVK